MNSPSGVNRHKPRVLLKHNSVSHDSQGQDENDVLNHRRSGPIGAAQFGQMNAVHA